MKKSFLMFLVILLMFATLGSTVNATSQESSKLPVNTSPEPSSLTGTTDLSDLIPSLDTSNDIGTFAEQCVCGGGGPKVETIYISNSDLAYGSAPAGTVSSVIKNKLARRVFFGAALTAAVVAAASHFSGHKGVKLTIRYKWQRHRVNYYTFEYAWVAYDWDVGYY